MKKGLLALFGLFLIVAIAGCAGIKVYKSVQERVDVEVAGNQGVIYGPTPAPHKVSTPSREFISVDVELPTMAEVKETFKKTPESLTQDKEAWGNKGTVSQAESTK